MADPGGSRSHAGAHDSVRKGPARAGLAPDRGAVDRAVPRRRRQRDRGARRDRGSRRDRGAAGRAPGVGAIVSAIRGMTPEDLTRILFVTDPQISPDGRRVAFVVTSLSEERDEYLANIWIVDAAGGAPRRFTAGPRRDIEPRWSPDGAQLAFLSERAPKDKLQLYVVPADGGEPTKLTALEHGVSSLAWSPDGSRLAFVSAVGGQREPDSEEEKRKSRPARVITSVKYRFNGEGFVYDRRPHVFVVSTDDSTPVQITDGDFIDADPTWSPDDDSIVIASARHAERSDDDANDLWRSPSKGGTPQRLTASTEPFVVPAAGSGPLARLVAGERALNGFSASADGRLLAFAASSPVAPAEVVTCRADGGDERRLTELNRAWADTVALSAPERFRFTRAGFELDVWVMRPAGFVAGQ